MAVGDNGRIDLASAEPFRVGLMIAEPALRQVSTTSTSVETIQPRVMQVLVALARANGGIVSRDAVVQQCWDGRIVGDDSINRVISRLRRLADERAGGSFKVETIARVGYRLVGDVALVHLPPPAPLRSEPPEEAAAVIAPQQPEQVRRRLLATLGVALGLAALFWWFGPSRSVAPAGLAVEPFAAAPRMAEQVGTLQNALVNGVAPQRLRAFAGTASRADYRLSGRIVGAPDGLMIFANLYPPGEGAPIWSPQKRVALNGPVAGVGAEMAQAAQCIVQGAEEPPLPRPRPALAGWARYCEDSNRSNWDEDLLIETLRDTVKADPSFVSGQTTLATSLAYHVMHAGGRDPDAMRPEAARALATAERLDPDNSSIPLTRAALTPLEDFGARETLIAQAQRVRQAGSGEEANAQGYHWEAVGRLRDSLAAYKRSLTVQPDAPTPAIARAEVLSMAGRYREALPVFVTGAATQPDRSRVDRIWLAAAITGGDWATARRLLPTIPDDATRSAMTPLLAALIAGDQAAAYKAGAPFERIATDSASLSALTVMALAWSGRDVAAIDAAERRFRVVGYNNSLGSLYSPGFAAARQRPEFEVMTRRSGLFAYWQGKGRAPDFCAAADAPALCTRL